MKALQAILGAVLLTLTVACTSTDDGSERVNHRASDTSSIGAGDLLRVIDSANNVACYRRYLHDEISCVLLKQPE